MDLSFLPTLGPSRRWKIRTPYGYPQLHLEKNVWWGWKSLKSFSVLVSMNGGSVEAALQAAAGHILTGLSDLEKVQAFMDTP